ncbi:MAG: PAS domain S-box protein, partial [Thermodesulfobacteriota bacterium]
MITVLSVVLSAALYSLISLVLGGFQTRGFLVSMFIPGIIAPPLAYVFLRILLQLIRTDAAYKESEMLYRAVFEHSRDAIYITSPDGRVMEINQAG